MASTEETFKPEPQPSTSPPYAPTPRQDDKGVQFQDASTGWWYMQYQPAREAEYLPAIRRLIGDDLSEPYSIYVYRYFLYEWPDLTFLCISPNNELVGVIINKLEPHIPPSRQNLDVDPADPPKNRGYIAMIATHVNFRKRSIARNLVRLSVDAMAAKGADEIGLETETSNVASLKLYEKMGFLRTKRLHRYYLNGNEAFRLIMNVASAPSAGHASSTTEEG